MSVLYPTDVVKDAYENIFIYYQTYFETFFSLIPADLDIDKSG